MTKSALYSLSHELYQHMTQCGRTLAIAESCTGGMIAETLTRVSGASSYFMYSYVTYSNEAKQSLLNVTTNTLEQHGAVSAQCASEMALGVLDHSDCDLALSVTGIAGPLGGSDTKPVGTVYLAVASKHTPTPEVVLAQLHSGRHHIRTQATRTALSLLIQHASAFSS